ncbi:class I SAM-dependent methyltransferase [Chryseobacterium formosus]|uniref:Class I SAM-dependent methyltransferase n=1 Tax=Chryseobacterium formosus TaxID=1537363 RepID=A0ABT3XUR0_9FLAO|nr:class I SAM-dependent methyltransferase [Chryseobacterium formosus]MCX8525381.1 class I SAM-dependent methyltransferase [Chryseobacterium formosus]
MEINEAKLLLPKLSLIKPEIWADLGCGNGTFTYALAEKLENKSKIFAIDRQRQNLSEKHHEIMIDYIQTDFENEDLNISPLDGILLANALHFVKDKTKLIRKLEEYFEKGNEKWIIIEYDNSIPNQWEPFPITFDELKSLFKQLGYSKIEKIGERKSVFGGTMYSAFITKT